MYDKKQLYNHEVVPKNYRFVIEYDDRIVNVFELDEKLRVCQVEKHVFQVINDYQLQISRLMVDILMVKHKQDEIQHLMLLPSLSLFLLVLILKYLISY